MRKLSVFIICLSFFYLGSDSCKKPSFNDLAGSSVIQGIIMLHDTLTGNYTYMPLGGQTVYLRNPKDSLGYLYSAKSDDLGQFSFAGFDSTADYLMYAGFDSGIIHYAGSLAYTHGDGHFLHTRDTLVLSIDTLTQNGLFFELKDAMGNRLNNASLYIFSSRILWLAAIDSIGSTYQLKADDYGRCLKLNIAPGLYYTRSRDSISPAIFWRGVDSVNVKAFGIQKVKDTLR